MIASPRPGGLIAELVGVRGAIVVGGLTLFAGSLPYVTARMWRVKTINQIEEAADLEFAAGMERPEVTIDAR